MPPGQAGRDGSAGAGQDRDRAGTLDGGVDPVGLRVDRHALREFPHRHGGRHLVGSPVDHHDLAGAGVGDIDEAGTRVGRDPLGSWTVIVAVTVPVWPSIAYTTPGPPTETWLVA